MESHLEALCGALMKEKIDDKDENIPVPESNIGIGIGESGSRVT